jgi:hypothetical protein
MSGQNAIHDTVATNVRRKHDVQRAYIFQSLQRSDGVANDQVVAAALAIRKRCSYEELAH